MMTFQIRYKNDVVNFDVPEEHLDAPVYDFCMLYLVPAFSFLREQLKTP